MADHTLSIKTQNGCSRDPWRCARDSKERLSLGLLVFNIFCVFKGFSPLIFCAEADRLSPRATSGFHYMRFLCVFCVFETVLLL